MAGKSLVGKEETAFVREHARGFRGDPKVTEASTLSHNPHRAAERRPDQSSEACGAVAGDSTVEDKLLAVNSAVHARCQPAGTDPVADQMDPHGDAPSDLLLQEAKCTDRTPAPPPPHSSQPID